MTTSKPEPLGLRDRKKAKRRDTILHEASELFAQKGIDTTTMADIARAVDVSVPTLFNYFGSKDGILIALLTEGAHKACSSGNALVMRDGVDFGTILADLFVLFARRTLKIASKRVWRYAEAAAIRHPTTELAVNYADVDKQLRKAIATFLNRYDLRLRNGDEPDSDYLAQLFFDTWNPAFFNLIKNEAMTIEEHRDEVLARFLPLAGMVFDQEFVDSPALKPTGPDLGDR